MKGSLNLHLLNTYQGKHANTHAGIRSHTTPATHTNSTPCSCLWMNRSLSLNWWSDKVGLNSRRHTGTHCRGRNMCFTSRAPSYTRANVTVCMRARVCVRTRVQHVFAISYQLLISVQQRRGDWVKERERTTVREREGTQWEKVITTQWMARGRGLKLSPISPSSHYSLCFAQLLYFSLPLGERERASISCPLWFRCACVCVGGWVCMRNLISIVWILWKMMIFILSCRVI